MKKNHRRTHIQGSPLRIIPIGETDLYEIHVCDSPLFPMFIGKTVILDLPKGLKTEIGERIGKDMSKDMEYPADECFRSLQVEGVFETCLDPGKEHVEEDRYISYLRASDGKLLNRIVVENIGVVILEPVLSAPAKPRFPIWLSPREQMRYLKYGQMDRAACALQVNMGLKDLLNTYAKDLGDVEDDFECTGDCENCPEICEDYVGACIDGTDDFECIGDCDNCTITCEDDEDDFECTGDCDSCPIVCDDDEGACIDGTDDFECTGDCDNCPVTCEDDEDDCEDSSEYSKGTNFHRDLWDLLGKAWSCEPEEHVKKPKPHAVKPDAEEKPVFDDCPFTGDGGKYFKAFVGTSGGKKAQKKISGYINTICGACRHNEECHSDHATKFFLMDDPADMPYISRFGNRTGRRDNGVYKGQDAEPARASRRDNGVYKGQDAEPARASRRDNGVYKGQDAEPARASKTDAVLPDYFGQKLYSFTDKSKNGSGRKGQMSYAGLFVKNFTGSVTLVPGILPLFDPHTRTLTCVEMCGLPEEAFNILYGIINRGGCPAVYVSIPEKKADFSYASTEDIGQMYIRGEKGRPLSPGRIIICDTAEGHFTAPVVSDIKIRKTADKKGKK